MTITEGMGLPNECFDALLKDMREIYDAHSTISDVLDNATSHVRDDEFGFAGNISAYEKKLMLAGYLVGMVHSENQHKEKLAEMVLQMLDKFTEEK